MTLTTGRLFHLLPGLLHEAVPAGALRAEVASLPEEAAQAHPVVPRLRGRQRVVASHRRRAHRAVEQRGAAVRQHVDGERHHPDQLDQVAADDRPAAAGHQVDQEPIREEADRHQDWTERIPGYHRKVLKASTVNREPSPLGGNTAPRY